MTTPALETLYALVRERAPRAVIDAHKLTLTADERGILFGDVQHGKDYDSGKLQRDYQDTLIDRLNRGLWLSKDDAKRARRYKRERKAAT